MNRRKENPVPAQIVMNRTLPRRQSSCVQLFPNWGSFLSNLMRQWNITEITQFDSMREKKRQHFQVKLLGTFFNYFWNIFPMFHIRILWVDQSSCSVCFLGSKNPWEDAATKPFLGTPLLQEKCFSSLKSGSSGRKQRMSSGAHFFTAFYHYIS